MHWKILALAGALAIGAHAGVALSEAAAQTAKTSNSSASVPLSDICVMPVPGTEADAIGVAIGPMIEAPKGNGVIIDSIEGLFHLGLDGSIKSLQSRQKTKSGGWTGELVALPWSDEIVAVGVDTWIIHQDLSIEEVGHGGFRRLIGVFPSIQSVFSKTTRVVGWNPFYGASLDNFLETINLTNKKYRLFASKTAVDYFPKIVDAPWFGAPIAWEPSGPFSVDRDGNLRKFEVEDIDPVDIEKLKDHEVVGLYYFAHEFFSVSSLRTLYVSAFDWYQIGPDRRASKIKGLPPYVEVSTHFDPGSNYALFGTAKGVYAVSPDGIARPLSGPSGSHNAIHLFAEDPDDRYLLAGGDDGLFRIRKDSLESAPVPNGSANIIGPVAEILPIGFARLSLVFTANGTFVYENGEIKAVPPLAAFIRPARPAPISIMPHLRRVLISKSDLRAPVINELRRSAEDGTCTRPLASATP
jgi:hypothetical protein